MIRKLILLLVITAALRVINPFSLAVVQGRSMEPTLHNGQFFVIDRVSYRMLPVTRGNVVAFRHENEIYIKRVVGVGGDTLWLWIYPQSGSAELVPRAQVVRMRRLAAHYPRMGVLKRMVVPSGQLFVVGDHRNVSYDSRDFGPVPLQVVIGRARW